MKKNYCQSIPNWKKLWESKLCKVMKTTFFLILVAISQVIAVGTYSQNTRISLNSKNSTIKDILAQIEYKSEFFFMYDATKVNVDQMVDISAENQLVTKILDLMFENRGISYTINNRQIALSSFENVDQVAQSLKVSGKVTDSSGSPLPGVSVVVKGTTNGTIADNNGNYSLSNVPENSVLQFSFVGMKMQQIAVGSKTTINVTLTEETIGIEDVVVVGYGTQKKINLTGSVGMVEAKEFETRPITNVTQSLQGQVPGLLINQTGGQPGNENFTIKIRGTSTFSGNEPLVIVDGIAMSMNSLNPQDIESISVLKDAASTAIYGARASGGVILVTTKKGKEGKISISYNGYAGVQNPTMLPDMVNAYEHVMLWREAQYNDNPNTTVYKYSLDEMEKYRTGELPSDNRVDYLFDPGLQTQHNLSISGGNSMNKYYISLGYIYQDGTMKNTSSNRYNIRINNNLKVNDRFDININAQFSPTSSHAPSVATYPGGPTRGISDIIYDTFRRGADDITFTSDGRWASITGWANRFGLASKDGGFQNQKFNRFSGVLTLNYKILPNLSINGMYGGKIDLNRQIDYSKRMKFINPDDLKTVDFNYNTNSLQIYHQDNYQHNLQFLLNYEKTINNIHEVKGLLGYSQEWNNDTQESVGRRKFVTDDIYVINGGSSDPSTWTTWGIASEWALMSYFGRLNYVFKNRYLFEANLRYDGSSRFSSDNRWGIFPSFSAGWRISEESFMKKIEWIDNLKIRGSWGSVGNQNIALYQYYSTIANAAYYFNGVAQTATYYSGTPNVDLKWETKTTTNLGIDLGFAKNKLNLILDIFKDRTTNILMRPSVPSTFGRTAPYQNVATIDNLGWESQISYSNKISNLSYGVTFQISDAKNKVVSMIGSPQINIDRITEIGYEMGEWFGYKAIGIFSSQEEVDNYAKLNPKTGIGDLKIQDFNNDGKITAADRQRLGSSNPRFPYGCKLELGWKNFDFFAFLQGVAYKKTFINAVAGLPINGGLETAQKQHLDRWHLSEDGSWIPGKFPKMRVGSFNNTFSSFWLQNAAYLRLKNIQLGYSLPASLLNKIKVERMRLYVSGENLFTLTKIYGFDPEAPNWDGSFFYPGNGTFYPLSQVVNFGVSITF
jgi:TonB-linked SusC/RagA family outer membrane protein